MHRPDVGRDLCGPVTLHTKQICLCCLAQQTGLSEPQRCSETAPNITAINSAHFELQRAAKGFGFIHLSPTSGPEPCRLLSLCSSLSMDPACPRHHSSILASPHPDIFIPMALCGVLRTQSVAGP